MKCSVCPFILACTAGSDPPRPIGLCHYCGVIWFRTLYTRITRRVDDSGVLFLSFKCAHVRSIPRVMTCCPSCDDTATLFGVRRTDANASELFWDLEDPTRLAAFSVWLRKKREERDK